MKNDRTEMEGPQVHGTKIGEKHSTKTRVVVLAVIASLAAIAVYAMGPIPQDPNYHAFADQRHGIFTPNWQNVWSNLPFVFVGILGLLAVYGKSVQAKSGGHAALGWYSLFYGVFLTGLGSAWYHWEPNHGTLFWDRLPMTLGFMGLFAVVIAERIGIHVYRRAVWPLLVMGVSSVVLWILSERAGSGDLRLYILVQFFPLMTIPLMMLIYPGPFTHGWMTVAALVMYGISKVLEFLDHQLYHWTGEIVSGHALKHLAAAMGCWILFRMYVVRRTHESKQQPSIDPSVA